MKNTDVVKKGLTVKVHNNNVNAALTILKKRITEEGLKKELRVREHYMSKGERKRKALAAAKRRYRKAIDEKNKLDMGVSSVRTIR